MKYVYYPDDIEGAEDIEGQIDSSGDRHDISVGSSIFVEDHAATRLKSTFPFLEVLTDKAWASRNGGEGLAAIAENDSNESDNEDTLDEESREDTKDTFDLATADYRQLQAKAKELGIKANQKPEALQEQIAEALK